MARFDVYENADNDGYLLDIQADLLHDMNTRVVVPLVPVLKAPEPAKRLNPVFLIDGSEMVMTTQFLAAVQTKSLQRKTGSLADHETEITNALDMLFFGF